MKHFYIFFDTIFLSTKESNFTLKKAILLFSLIFSNYLSMSIGFFIFIFTDFKKEYYFLIVFALFITLYMIFSFSSTLTDLKNI
jgi:hypothetical protein